MISLLIIATTLLTRGVNNVQEAAVLVGAPPIALANYTYHYLEDINFNYTELTSSIFSTEFWLSSEQISSMRNTTEYWMKEIPAFTSQVQKQFYQRAYPSETKVLTPKINLEMLFVGMYLMSLFTLAAGICLLKPGSKQVYEDLDSDHILSRKRKRAQTPMDFYDMNRMLLRSETTENDVFYKLE